MKIKSIISILINVIYSIIVIPIIIVLLFEFLNNISFSYFIYSFIIILLLVLPFIALYFYFLRKSRSLLIVSIIYEILILSLILFLWSIWPTIEDSLKYSNDFDITNTDR